MSVNEQAFSKSLEHQKLELVTTTEQLYDYVAELLEGEPYRMTINPATIHQQPYCKLLTDIAFETVVDQAQLSDCFSGVLGVETYEYRLRPLQVFVASVKHTLTQKSGKVFHRNLGFHLAGMNEPFIIDGMWQQFLDEKDQDPLHPRVVHGTSSEVIDAVMSFGVSEKWLPYLSASTVVQEWRRQNGYR